MHTSDGVADGESEHGDGSNFGLSRRATLGALGAAGLGLSVGRAGAAQGDETDDGDGDGGEPWYRWKNDVDAGGNDLTALGALGTQANGEPIADFAGENLAIEEGTLHAGSTVNFVDVDDYGADPTGDEPSDGALDAAIDDLSDGDVLVMTDGEYWFDGPHEIYDDYVTVLGTGSEIRVSGVEYGAYAHFLSFGNYTAVNDFGGDTRNANDVSEGQQAIEVRDVSPFSVGDDVTVSETKFDNTPTLAWGGDHGRETCPTRAVVREIDGSTLYLDRGLNYDHGAGNAGVFRLDSVVGGRFVDMHMTNGDGENESEGFLMTAYARDCKYINCTSEEYVGFPFTDIHSLRTVMVDCEATNPILPRGRASSHWEPFQFRGSTDATVVRPSIDTCRRGIDINAGSKVVRVFDPRIRNAYLHGMCFHSNAAGQVYGAYEVYGGRVEAASEVLHDKYHWGAGLSLSPNMSWVKAIGTTVIGRSRAIHGSRGTASNLTLQGCELSTFAGDPPASLQAEDTHVINAALADSTVEDVTIVARGGNDASAVSLPKAENVSVSGTVSGTVTGDVIRVAGADGVDLDVNVSGNENEDAADVLIDGSRNVHVGGTLHGAGPSVATSGDVADVRVVDVDARSSSGPAIGHVGGGGNLSNVWVTGCNTVGGRSADIDFESGLVGSIHGLWIQNNVCGGIAHAGSDSDEDKFVSENLAGQASD